MEKTKELERIIEMAWLGLSESDITDIDNIFYKRTPEDVEKPHIHLLKLFMKPENFAFACRHILNLNILPMQAVMLHDMWWKPFVMLIGSRGLSKTFTLAIYCLLRAMFLQPRKVVICAASFRQAKFVMQYIETIWQNAPILRDLCRSSDKKQHEGVRKDIDRWMMTIGQSTIVCLPLGNGSKIRGERANDIIAEEFSSINPEIYETVISGFSIVSANPVEKVKEEAIRKLKLENPELELGEPKSYILFKINLGRILNLRQYLGGIPLF